MIQTSCNKLIAIDPPSNTITTNQIFADSADAISALAGIYSKIINTGANPIFGTGGITIFSGLSSDELVIFNINSSDAQFYTSSLNATNTAINNIFWAPPYAYVYQINACIEGLQASTTIESSIKNNIIGEAKFLRAYIYFYLINLFGDVPYITSTAWAQTALSPRNSKSKIYELIIDDLKEAQNILADNFSSGNGERIRANKWTATALLARVYLYLTDFVNAESQATTLLSNTSDFSLVADLNNVFKKNSTEAILQWKLNTSQSPYNATPEGRAIIPLNATRNPSYYITSQLRNAFETGDNRKIAWLNSTTYSGTVYFYPYKYKVGPAQQSPNAIASEYYTILRLAEQYLIRAEARVLQNNLMGAISDLNIIRKRAGIPNLPSSLTQVQIMAAVEQERRIELFAEWGHRWLDLKRTNRADAVLAPIKGNNWQNTDQLYPIPTAELNKNPNLTQNASY